MSQLTDPDDVGLITPAWVTAAAAAGDVLRPAMDVDKA